MRHCLLPVTAFLMAAALAFPAHAAHDDNILIDNGDGSYRIESGEIYEDSMHGMTDRGMSLKAEEIKYYASNKEAQPSESGAAGGDGSASDGSGNTEMSEGAITKTGSNSSNTYVDEFGRSTTVQTAVHNDGTTETKYSTDTLTSTIYGTTPGNSTPGTPGYTVPGTQDKTEKLSESTWKDGDKTFSQANYGDGTSTYAEVNTPGTPGVTVAARAGTTEDAAHDVSAVYSNFRVGTVTTSDRGASYTIEGEYKGQKVSVTIKTKEGDKTFSVYDENGNKDGEITLDVSSLGSHYDVVDTKYTWQAVNNDYREGYVAGKGQWFDILTRDGTKDYVNVLIDHEFKYYGSHNVRAWYWEYRQYYHFEPHEDCDDDGNCTTWYERVDDELKWVKVNIAYEDEFSVPMICEECPGVKFCAGCTSERCMTTEFAVCPGNDSSAVTITPRSVLTH